MGNRGCRGGGHREARVEVLQLGLLEHHRPDEVHGVRDDDGLEAVRPGHDDVVGVHQVEGRNRPEGGRVGQVHGGQAERRMADDVGGAEGEAAVLEEDLLEAFRGGPDGSLGAVLRLDLGELLGRVVPGLLPGNGPPFPLTPCARSDQWLLQTIGIINLFHGRVPAGAEHAAGARAFRIGIQFMNDAVVHDGQDGALVGAHLAGGRNHELPSLGAALPLLEVLEAAQLAGESRGGRPRGRHLHEGSPVHQRSFHGSLPLSNESGGRRQRAPRPGGEQVRSGPPA